MISPTLSVIHKGNMKNIVKKKPTLSLAGQDEKAIPKWPKPEKDTNRALKTAGLNVLIEKHQCNMKIQMVTKCGCSDMP